VNTQHRQTGSDRFVARFRWIAPAAVWVGELFKGRCPDCRAAISLSNIAGKRHRSGETAECPACHAQWVLSDSNLRFYLKFVFLGFPLVFLFTGLAGTGLEQIPFFHKENARGINDNLHFWAFPFLGFAFFSSFAFFLRLLPLKKVNS